MLVVLQIAREYPEITGPNFFLLGRFPDYAGLASTGRPGGFLFPFSGSRVPFALLVDGPV